MFDHLSLGVTHLDRAIHFYDAVCSALGYARVWTRSDAVGYGVPPSLEDRLCIKQRLGASPPGPGFHVALSASSREAVDLFFRAALDAGGRDDGAPGFRPQYGPNYYAAFVIDPDGHHIEAVCHRGL